MTNERQLERDEENANWLRDNQISSIRGKLPPEGQMGPEHCEECGNDLPMPRRKHGFRLCVECAAVGERHGR